MVLTMHFYIFVTWVGPPGFRKMHLLDRAARPREMEALPLRLAMGRDPEHVTRGVRRCLLVHVSWSRKC
jgi:hypothetical protein